MKTRILDRYHFTLSDMRETRMTKQALQIETVAIQKFDIKMTRAQIKRTKQEQGEFISSHSKKN